YLANSYSTFTIDTTIINWITLSKPERYYAAGNHGFSKFKEAILEALSKLDNSEGGGSSGSFDFTEFDLDENGALDGLGILHSGYGAEFGGDDCYNTKNEDRIWSHKGGVEWTSSSGGSTSSSVKVDRYYVSSALRGKCQSNIVRMGVICHELGHYLGLPDLYDGTFAGVGLGAYDFMSQSWGLDGSGLYPPNLSAWSKLQVGWAHATLIEYDGMYELEASATSDRVYKITHGFPSGEYLLLENRQPLGYDSKITQGGIAIYHIDENAKGQRSRGYPNNNEKEIGSTKSYNWPENGDHYKVALLGADGKYDLERGNNQGDGGDLWHADSILTELKPSKGIKKNYPNTDTYQNGKIDSTGIRIFGFSQSGNVMTFSVEGLGLAAESIISLETMFAASSKVAGAAEVTTTATTPPPTTPRPTTPRPTTSSPTTSHPVSSAPTSHPTSPPSSPPSSPPTASPTTGPPPSLSPITLCSNQSCLTPISSLECPPVSSPNLPSCLDVEIGELCDADGECDTDQFLNNCGLEDVYRRIDCAVATD
ncbi:hypothetical protein ACHAXR_001734, partial [Thalassiosira sp. AJA248-18]